MELKTLKDFIRFGKLYNESETECILDKYASIDDLKQSAIKDIKEIRTTKPYIEHQLVEVVDPKAKPIIKTILTIEGKTLIDWIKWKFNITDEDLE